MSRIEIVESYAKVFNDSRQGVQEIRKSALNRLVWFVGISGYAILNSQKLWESLANKPITGINLIYLSWPWVISAFLSVITHFMIDETATRDEIYFNSKKSAIDLHRIDVLNGKENPGEMIAIVNDTLPGIKEAKEKVDKSSVWSKWLERLSFGFLAFGFIWTFVAPFLLCM